MSNEIEREKKYLHFLRELVNKEEQKLPQAVSDKLEELRFLNESYDQKIAVVASDTEECNKKIIALNDLGEKVSRKQAQLNARLEEINEKTNELKKISESLSEYKQSLDKREKKIEEKSKELDGLISSNISKESEYRNRCNDADKQLKVLFSKQQDAERERVLYVDKTRELEKKIKMCDEVISDTSKEFAGLSEERKLFQSRREKIDEERAKIAEREKTTDEILIGVKKDRMEIKDMWMTLRREAKRRKIEHIFGDKIK